MNLLDRASALFIGDPMAVPEFAAAPDLPPDVRFRAGRLVPWIGGVLARMSAPAAAVTLGRTIVVNPATALTPELVEHELTHVRQWRADPLFPVRYTLATLRHGYHDNPYEVEARRAAEACRAGLNASAPAPGAASVDPATPRGAVSVDPEPSPGAASIDPATPPGATSVDLATPPGATASSILSGAASAGPAATDASGPSPEAGDG